MIVVNRTISRFGHGEGYQDFAAGIKVGGLGPAMFIFSPDRYDGQIKKRAEEIRKPNSVDAVVIGKLADPGKNH